MKIILIAISLAVSSISFGATIDQFECEIVLEDLNTQKVHTQKANFDSIRYPQKNTTSLRFSDHTTGRFDVSTQVSDSNGELLIEFGVEYQFVIDNSTSSKSLPRQNICLNRHQSYCKKSDNNCLASATICFDPGMDNWDPTSFSSIGTAPIFYHQIPEIKGEIITDSTGNSVFKLDFACSNKATLEL